MQDVKRYQRGDSRFVQAQRVWLILTGRSVWIRETLTYGDLAEIMGYSRQAGVTLSTPLGIVGKFCLAQDIPSLVSLVVRGDTGEPGPGVIFSPKRTLNAEQRLVLGFDWYSVRVPSTKMLREAWSKLDNDD